MRAFAIVFCPALLLLLAACNTAPKEPANPVHAGAWRFAIAMQPDIELPFTAEWAYRDGKPVLTILNAAERMEADEITFRAAKKKDTGGDSVFIRMPFFDSEFRAKMTGDTALVGEWIKHGSAGDTRFPLTAHYGKTERFAPDAAFAASPAAIFAGKWETTFSPDSALDQQSKAIGLFTEEPNGKITGTFATETGDYRFLEGRREGAHIRLSCFDGSHAYLFTGEAKGGVIHGTFYSGKSHREAWTAKRNPSFELRNPDELTFLKPGYKKVEFEFLNLDGKIISLADARYRNKPVIVQIMGSWCPNCLDEARLFSDLYRRYHPQGLEVVALAFEYSPDFGKAAAAVRRHKERLKCDYEFCITGIVPKNADEALPMLNHVMSFPTSIFMDKQGHVRKIHTGFYGPGTGAYYTRFVAETEGLIEKMLRE